MLCLITYKVRSENEYGFLRPGLKTGVGNGIFWSEIGSGFGDAGGTPPPKLPKSTPRVQITNHEPEKFRLDCWKCVNCEAARLTWRWFWMLHVVAESLFLYFCVWVCLLCLVLMYWKFSNPWNKQIITLSPCLMWKSHHKIPRCFVEAAWPSDLGRWIWNLEAPPLSNPSPHRYLDLFSVFLSSVLCKKPTGQPPTTWVS